MSDAMRLIEAGEAFAPGEQPPIVLSWEDYKALVAERDEAREQLETAKKASIWCTCDECGFYRSDGQQMRRERDEARQCAREIRNRLREFSGQSTDARKEVLAQEAAHPWLKEPTL